MLDKKIKKKFRRCDTGFTLIETLVILGILSVFSAMLFYYSRTGEGQIVLFKEGARVRAALVRAKSLAIETYGELRPPCGYGVHFAAPRTVILYTDQSADCQTSSHEYTASGQEVESFDLDRRLTLADSAARDIFFLPPDPQVFIIPDAPLADITLQVLGSSSQADIRVTKTGQISME